MRFGNPFKEATNEESVRKFREALIAELVALETGFPEIHPQMRCIATHLHELRGVDLACFCREDQACHADVLLEFANKTP